MTTLQLQFAPRISAANAAKVLGQLCPNKQRRANYAAHLYDLTTGRMAAGGRTGGRPHINVARPDTAARWTTLVWCRAAHNRAGRPCLLVLCGDGNTYTMAIHTVVWV